MTGTAPPAPGRHNAPLARLRALGQSVWLDDLRREWLQDGTLAALIDEGVSGITSNPATFRNAIESGRAYDADIARLAAAGADARAAYEALTVADVGAAADLLRPLWEQTAGGDGYVSIEVSPHLADDTEATLVEAQRLWKLLARPNVMIKVPGTRAGLPAIRRLIAAGVNVNVTLLFSAARCAAAAEAYMAGVEDALAAGRRPPSSVASLFLSRIDARVDPELDAAAARGAPGAAALRGRAALETARLAYRGYRELTAHPRWRALAARGARPQRLLWASTAPKDPAASDVKYVDALAGPDTVATLRLETLRAYQDHGEPAPRLGGDTDADSGFVAGLAAAGVDLAATAEALEREGVALFREAFDATLRSLAQRLAAAP